MSRGGRNWERARRRNLASKGTVRALDNENAFAPLLKKLPPRPKIAKLDQRAALTDAVAEFLAKGGQITRP